MTPIAPLLILLLAQQPPQARAQGRQGQPPATTPAATPAATPPAQPQATPGGRGRGGIAGPGPAVGGEVDETPVVTHHSVTVGGKALNYTATVAPQALIYWPLGSWILLSARDTPEYAFYLHEKNRREFSNSYGFEAKALLFGRFVADGH